MITIVIIAITVVVSLIALGKKNMLDSMMFNACQVHHHRKYYRLLSYGLCSAVCPVAPPYASPLPSFSACSMVFTTSSSVIEAEL